MLRRTFTRSAALIAFLLAAACSGTSTSSSSSGNASDRSDRSGPEASRGGNDGSAGKPSPSAPLLADVRVMMYQPKGDLLLILVNESHSGRKTEAGRLDIALGDTNRAYKVLPDQRMRALIESLQSRGYDQYAETFAPGDESYLAASARDLPRYQGMIFVEGGGKKTKVLGFRKSSEGDLAGQKRYAAFTDQKALVQWWFSGTSMSEFPVGGVAIPTKND